MGLYEISEEYHAKERPRFKPCRDKEAARMVARVDEWLPILLTEAKEGEAYACVRPQDPIDGFIMDEALWVERIVYHPVAGNLLIQGDPESNLIWVYFLPNSEA